MCRTCDSYDTQIALDGLKQLRRLVAKLRAAVRAGVLHTAPAFAELDIEAGMPDVLNFDFRCRDCAAVFRLRVETYHGQGGTWSKV